MLRLPPTEHHQILRIRFSTISVAMLFAACITQTTIAQSGDGYRNYQAYREAQSSDEETDNSLEGYGTVYYGRSTPPAVTHAPATLSTASSTPSTKSASKAPVEAEEAEKSNGNRSLLRSKSNSSIRKPSADTASAQSGPYKSNSPLSGDRQYSAYGLSNPTAPVEGDDASQRAQSHEGLSWSDDSRERRQFSDDRTPRRQLSDNYRCRRPCIDNLAMYRTPGARWSHAGCAASRVSASILARSLSRPDEVLLRQCPSPESVASSPLWPSAAVQASATVRQNSAPVQGSYPSRIQGSNWFGNSLANTPNRVASNAGNSYRTTRNSGSVNRNSGYLDYYGQPYGNNRYAYGNNFYYGRRGGYRAAPGTVLNNARGVTVNRARRSMVPSNYTPAGSAFNGAGAWYSYSNSIMPNAN